MILMFNTKSLPFVAFIFSFSLILSYSLKVFFERILISFSAMSSVYSLFTMIVLIFLLLTVTGILYLLIDSNERWMTTMIAAIGFLIGFNLIDFNLYNFLVSLLLGTIFTFAIYYFDTQLGLNYRNMIQPDFSSAIEHSAGGFIFFFSLIVAVNFYLLNQSPIARDALLQRGLSLIVDPVANLAHEDSLKILEGLSPSVRDITGRNQMLTKEEAELINDQTTAVVKSAFAKQMDQYKVVILNIITLLIFLSLFSVFKLAKILIGPLVTLLIIILKKTNYIEEEKETVEIVRYRI
jgi:hypothetical protein